MVKQEPPTGLPREVKRFAHHLDNKTMMKALELRTLNSTLCDEIDLVNNSYEPSIEMIE